MGFNTTDPAEVRRQNLRYLVDRYGQSVVAKRMGKPDRQIADILAGRKSFGEKVAGSMEASWGDATGETIDLASLGMIMDYKHDYDDGPMPGNVREGPDMQGRLPLISWVRAGELCESPEPVLPADAEDWFDCPVKHGPRAYCLRVSGDSMDDGTPEGYRDGEIIFVDPDAGATPGRDVIVRTPDNKTTFKRLKEDTEGRYLLGLNGKKIVRVPEGTTFCGVVVFSGVKRG